MNTTSRPTRESNEEIAPFGEGGLGLQPIRSRPWADLSPILVRDANEGSEDTARA